ncbi:MAG TPA: EfeM/EfeO family lipoprotein, partial [Intrasporangium sp.]|uniref:EfeM/EfeO family lipoprotein n=1 Tax=Intrasporangium sp. TaxID=1925024 RepID=UPI002D78BF18
ITGEEERYSHTDLWDFKGNLVGSQQAVGALKPVIVARNAHLQEELDAKFAALTKLLESHKAGDGYQLYTQLSKADLQALTVALDALSEEVAEVSGVVGTT